MKLIKMTDFVLEIYKDKDLELLGNGWMNVIVNYANFLKQPLELWMFVPCDDDGNVLDEPEFHEPNNENEIGDYDEFRYEYQQAKERCFFEGFKLDGKCLWLNDSLFMISDDYNKSFKNYGNIESLLNKYLTGGLKLTQTAQKQLGI